MTQRQKYDTNPQRRQAVCVYPMKQPCSHSSRFCICTLMCAAPQEIPMAQDLLIRHLSGLKLPYLYYHAW